MVAHKKRMILYLLGSVFLLIGQLNIGDASAACFWNTYSYSGTDVLQNGKIAVTIDCRFGGAITSITPLIELGTRPGGQPQHTKGQNLVGQNLVDTYDPNCNCFNPGALIQSAFYQYGDSYNTSNICHLGDTYGWNPTQAGDSCVGAIHGSPTIAYSNTGSTIYTKSIPLQWDPCNKGGGCYQGGARASDLYFEQWISLDGAAIKYQWKVTNTGTTSHLAPILLQEVPAIYGNTNFLINNPTNFDPPFTKFATYIGSSPWQWQQYTYYTLPVSPQPAVDAISSEYWGAMIDDYGYGITLYSPQHFSHIYAVKIPLNPDKTYKANYMRGGITFGIPPNGSVQGTSYLIIGDYWDARAYIYNLHSHGQ